MVKCEVCQLELPPARTKPARYCGTACRMFAYRRRNGLRPATTPAEVLRLRRLAARQELDAS